MTSLPYPRPIIRGVCAVLAAAAVQTIAAGPNPAARTIEKWDLWKDSTQLRGANIWQTRSYKGTYDYVEHSMAGPAFKQEEFDRLSAMGANYVQISHPGLFTERPPYRIDKASQDNLDSLLAMICKADMFAVIAFRSGPGRSEFTFVRDEADRWYNKAQLDETIWQDRRKQDAWIEMCRHTARRYRDNPIVVGYEFMVEPNGNVSTGRPGASWTPEAFYPEFAGTRYDWNLFYPRIIKAVREIDTRTPLLVGGMGYSSIDWLPYLTRSMETRVVYVVHQYAPHTTFTHQPPNGGQSYPSPERGFDKQWLERLLAPAQQWAGNRSRIAITEFGVARWVPGAAAFIRDQMTLFEKRGWNHAVWVFHPETYPASGFPGNMHIELGVDPRNTIPVKTNALLAALQTSWARNTLRPSTARTVTGPHPETP